MASRAYQSNEAVSVGRIISRGFAAITSNPGVIFGIAFLFGALPSVILSYFSQNYRLELATQPNGIRDSIFLSIATAIIGLILGTIVQGAMVRATVASSEGRRASFGESVIAGLRVLLPLILIILIIWFCASIGFIFFMVPGIILYLVWSVATPAVVEERVGVFGALGRSASLTKGARWKIFGFELLILLFWWFVLAIVSYVMIIIEGGGLQGMMRMSQSGFPVSWLIVNAIAATLINAVWSTMQTSLYIELRDWKDGPASRQLEEVFA